MATALVFKMPWWSIITLLVVSVMAYIIAVLISAQPSHITSADTDQETSFWQLIYDVRERSILWEAELIDAQSFNHCIQFKFQMVHPMKKQKTVMIWQDQVDIETWRKLKVISRWK